MSLSQTDVGDFVGITKSMVSKWERGLHIQNASISKVSRLCSLLDIDANLVLFNSEKIDIEDYKMYVSLYLKNLQEVEYEELQRI